MWCCHENLPNLDPKGWDDKNWDLCIRQKECLKNRGRKVRGKESDFLYAAGQPETCSQQHANTSVFKLVEPFCYFSWFMNILGFRCGEIAGHRQEFPNIAVKEAWLALPRQPHTSYPSHVHAIYTQRGVPGIFECGIETQELQLFPNVCARMWMWFGPFSFVSAALTHWGTTTLVGAARLHYQQSEDSGRNISVCWCFPAVSM